MKDIFKSLAVKYGVTPEKIEEIYRLEFRLVAEHIDTGNLESIRLMYFGSFFLKYSAQLKHKTAKDFDSKKGLVKHINETYKANRKRYNELGKKTS